MRVLPAAALEIVRQIAEATAAAGVEGLVVAAVVAEVAVAADAEAQGAVGPAAVVVDAAVRDTKLQKPTFNDLCNPGRIRPGLLSAEGPRSRNPDFGPSSFMA